METGTFVPSAVGAHRAIRLKKLAKVLVRQGVVSSVEFFAPSNPATTSPWVLRVEGLERRLYADEWARVLYRICKHRGFYWKSKAEQNKKDNGEIKSALSSTQELLEKNTYRSVADMMLKEHPDAQRNKRGEYKKAIKRELLNDELELLFAVQREKGNPHEELENIILELFWEQKPALSGDALLKMVGNCTFEKDEYRAPKAIFFAERHVVLARLNNLRLLFESNDNKAAYYERALTDNERVAILKEIYAQASDMTYKQVRALLIKKGFIAKEAKIYFKGLLFLKVCYIKIKVVRTILI